MKRLTDAKTWVEISKKALDHNAGLFRKRLGKSVGLMAVVKSNAYGHGLIESAKILAPRADWFGVDNIDEALALKKAGIRRPILCLGFTPSWRMKEAVRGGIRMTISNAGAARAAKAAAAATGKTGYLHVKVETGTTRQGAELRDLPEIAAVIRSSKRLVFEGLSTHYANIEDTADHAYASEQLERFDHAVKILEAHDVRPPLKHTACTAAAMLFPETHFNLARVGIGLYGLWPSPETRQSADEAGLNLTLKPVMAWKTRIAQVKPVKRGAPISYGLTERMTKDGKVAVLGVGYWDGFDRGLSSVGEVMIRGCRARIIGRVCMNMCMADVSQISGVKAEDEVTLIGPTLSADELALKIGTINYEAVTRVNPTLPRVVV
jgi:alanine racemase